MCIRNMICFTNFRQFLTQFGFIYCSDVNYQSVPLGAHLHAEAQECRLFPAFEFTISQSFTSHHMEGREDGEKTPLAWLGTDDCLQVPSVRTSLVANVIAKADGRDRGARRFP